MTAIHYVIFQTTLTFVLGRPKVNINRDSVSLNHLLKILLQLRARIAPGHEEKFIVAKNKRLSSTDYAKEIRKIITFTQWWIQVRSNRRGSKARWARNTKPTPPPLPLALGLGLPLLHADLKETVFAISFCSIY